MKITAWATALAAGLLLAGTLLLASGALRGEADAATPSGASLPGIEQALAGGKPTVVEFGANACVACREMKPVLAALARDRAGRISVAEVDIIKQPEYISRYKIQLMPTQVFFDAQGRETSRHMGKISAAAMLARLQPAGGPAKPVPAP